MLKEKQKQIMAHILVPLSFLILGYSLTYIALKPVVDLGTSFIGMLITQNAPGFDGSLNSIYTGNTLTGGTVPLADVVIPDIGTHYAQITSTRIGLDAPVYFGDSYKILNRGVGHFGGSFLPGFGKTILLSGHNNTFFAPLEHIIVGDILTYQTNYGTYTYRVRETKILHYADPTAVDLTADREQLILYTCYDFSTLGGRKQQRLFVYLDRISGPDVR